MPHICWIGDVIPLKNQKNFYCFKKEYFHPFNKLQEALTGNEAKTQTAKFIGALSGVLISHTPEGAYSAA
ncbi:hypothetical protein BB987_03455 [Photorhabdus temperata]|uniref:hypothetical protein n=1 Tax=Photorhabdus khanii TaxID=1004150 RepID=UPI0004B91046|nr:hypothetical protein [Photorhabdus khanii]OHV48068.1 hypothetical protein BB987_03455 [Photorhabdus temperata]